MSVEATMREFLRWVARQERAEYGTIAYWVGKYIEEKSL